MIRVRFFTILCCIFISSCLVGNKGPVDPQALLQNISIVRISSVNQHLLDANHIVLEGEVDIMLDTAMHIRAERVSIDQEKKTLEAFGSVDGSLLFESPSFAMLADSFFLNLETREGHAENLRFHYGDKNIAAKKAQLLPNMQWVFDSVQYTACDHAVPHWSFSATSASLKNNLLRAKNIFFRLKNVPILWFPGIIIPSLYKNTVSKSASSGFLMPRLAWDKNLGFGITQEYYANFTRHFDSLLGVNWRQYKGYMIYDRLRHARSPRDFSELNVKFAREFNAFVQKDDDIVKTHSNRYSISGKNFQTFLGKRFAFDTMQCLNVGTDKNLDYEFLGKTDGIEDQFYNNITMRPHSNADIFSFFVDNDSLSREQFTFNGSKESLKQQYMLLRAPHFEWDSIGLSVPQVDFSCQSHLMVDYAYSRRMAERRLFSGSIITETIPVVPLTKEGTLRLNYEARIFQHIKLFENEITLELAPLVQLRSNVQKHNGDEDLSFQARRARLLLQPAAEWVLPEITFTANSWSATVNSKFNWDAVVATSNHSFFLMDEFDYVFPRNQIEYSFSNDFLFNNGSAVGWYLKQPYEFHDPSVIFSLRRPTRDTHWLPLKLGGYGDFNYFRFETEHEIDAGRADLLQSMIDCMFTYNRFKAGLTLIHQRPKLQKARELLSDIPSFALVHLRAPFLKNLVVSYEGNFYSASNSLIGGLIDPRPLYHQLKIEYQGHCWRAMIGYEEKRYRQEGGIKREPAFLFSFSLTSLGSFTKNFKQEPEIMKAPSSFYSKR